MHQNRPSPGRPANRRRQDRERGLLRLVPREGAFVAASPDAEDAAHELVTSARAEADEQGRLAAHHRERALHHAAQQVELLKLAHLTESVVWA